MSIFIKRLYSIRNRAAKNPWLRHKMCKAKVKFNLKLTRKTVYKQNYVFTVMIQINRCSHQQLYNGSQKPCHNKSNCNFCNCNKYLCIIIKAISACNKTFRIESHKILHWATVGTGKSLNKCTHWKITKSYRLCDNSTYIIIFNIAKHIVLCYEVLEIRYYSKDLQILFTSLSFIVEYYL